MNSVLLELAYSNRYCGFSFAFGYNINETLFLLETDVASKNPPNTGWRGADSPHQVTVQGRKSQSIREKENQTMSSHLTNLSRTTSCRSSP